MMRNKVQQGHLTLRKQGASEHCHNTYSKLLLEAHTVQQGDAKARRKVTPTSSWPIPLHHKEESNSQQNK